MAEAFRVSVVTSCSGYGKYLADWARSIAAQTRKPAAAAVLVHGDTTDTEHLPTVRRILEAAGVPCTIEVVSDRLDFGDARNRAVRLTSTDWVMHLDADDMLLPHALADAAAIADRADVIGFGYERTGDLRSGPSNPTRIYSPHDGRQALDAAAPCSGVSPFRREFFDRSPYRLGMLGAWDTALWIGFAKLGARFRPTSRPVFQYRQHADSVFNRRRLTFDWTRAHVQSELHGLRQDWDGVSVVIPHRPDNGPRDRSLEFVREWYAARFPGWQVVVGRDAGAGLWSKGAAIRDGLTRATGAVLVIADGDCLVDADALAHCVEAVGTVEAPAPGWAIPHRNVYRLSEPASLAYMRGDLEDAVRPPATPASLIRPAYEGYAGGGFVAVRRDRWEAAGGIPLEFAGWGCEDEALAVILSTLLGEPLRLSADLVHLWHPPGDRTGSAVYAQNRKRLSAYRAVAGDVGRMWATIASQGGKAATTAAPDMRLEYERRRIAARDRTMEIRAEQKRRNAEQRSLTDAALAAARLRRLEAEGRHKGRDVAQGE